MSIQKGMDQNTPERTNKIKNRRRRRRRRERERERRKSSGLSFSPTGKFNLC